ncbi:MAG: hypothetical protein LUD22_03425 [Coprobacillus sp.]|nr:hypothetical protein [Coprobacillus sp.]
MKKKSFLLIPILLFSLCGCNGSTNSEKINLSYGSLIDEEATLITRSTLRSMCDNEESFILVSYPGDDSRCSCWITFSKIIDSYVQEHEEIIYKINYGNIGGEDNEFGLSIYNDRPTLCFFEKGKLQSENIYNTKNEQAFFKNKESFENFIEESVNTPKIVYINEDLLETWVNQEQTFTIMYEWSTCPDCQYCLPNVIIPYFNDNPDSHYLYLIDLAVEGILLNNGVQDKNNQSYIDFMNKYGLSKGSNEKFGYTEIGVVPTLQRYENGAVCDAAVYFNDEIEIAEDGKSATIVDSFYSQDRIEYLTGATSTDVKYSVLVGQTYGEDDINDLGNGEYEVKHSSMATYHDPLLINFLNYY